MKLENRVIFITGAASGIGLETARAMANKGARLALTDVDSDALANVASELTDHIVYTRSLDVSDASAYRICVSQLIKECGVPDVLVNNAGVGLTGEFSDYTLADWDWIIDVNVKGVINGCHFLAPEMIKRQSGHIVNVASGLGLVAAPDMSAYCTTKFAIVGFSESLRSEMARHKVGVSAICPGIVNTNITQSMKVASGEQNQIRENASKLYSRRNYTPDRVAAKICRAVERNKGLVPVCPETHIAYGLKRVIPSMAAGVVARLSGSATGH